MTVSTSSPRTVSYAGDGGSGPFSVPFRVLEPGDLKAAVIAADGARSSLAGFSVSGAGEPSGATVTTEAPIAVGETLVLWTETAAVQPADYLAADAFPAETHEGALDRLTLIAQDARRDIDRAFKVAVGEEAPAELTYPAFVADAAAAVGEAALAQVVLAGEDQAAAVVAAGAGQAALVAAAGAQQVDLLEGAGAAQAALVEDAGDARLALIAAAKGGELFASPANALSGGAVAIQAITAGGSGTNGTFDAAISGGGGTGMAIRFVVGGGAVTSAVILNPGVNYTSAPTISLAASAGLTGAAITVTLGPRRTVGQYFTTPGTGGAAVNVYRVDSGPAATLVGRLEAWQAKALRYFYGRARHDTAVSAGARPWVEPYRLRMYMGVLAGGAVKNANGTYTLPPAATWTSPQLSAGVFDVAGDRFAYVPTTTETSAAIEIKVFRAGTILAAGNTATQPSADVYRQTWNNGAALTYVQIEIKNVSATAVTIYPIEVYTADAGHFPQVLHFDDLTPVPETRRIIDWNAISPRAVWNSKRLALATGERDVTVALDQVSGDDGAAGTVYAPKKSLGGIGARANGDIVGLKDGSHWKGESISGLGTATQGLTVRRFANGGRKPWPRVDGGVDLAGPWTQDGANPIWSCTVPCEAAAIANDGYSISTVLEVSTALVTQTPWAAESLVTPYNSLANLRAATGAGSYAIKPTATTMTFYVKTSDGLAPGTGAYDYRGSVCYCVLDWKAGNVRSGITTGVIVTQSSFGYGAFSGGPLTFTQGIVAAHGWTHTYKMEAGETTDFVFYNKGANTNTGNCYISPSANGYSWRWSRGYAIECGSAFYCHAAGGSYDTGEMSYIWMLQKRQSNGSLWTNSSHSTDQTTAAVEEYLFIQGYMDNGRAGNYAVPTASSYRYCLHRSIGRFKSRKLTQHCIAQVENISDPGSVNNRAMRLLDISEDHVVENCLLYATNVDVSGTAATGDYAATAIRIDPTGLNNPNIRKTIFLIDTALATQQTLVTETAAGMAWQSDYNVFIFCTPGSVGSTKFGNGTGTTIARYQSDFPGHDANSLFVDLRDDPRGAKAIFLDPAIGDFRWAQTAVAKRVKAYCDLYGIGPNWTISAWPTVPTADEAINSLMAT